MAPFTPKSMRRMGIAIVTIDVLLLVLWLCGGFYLAFHLETLCYEIQAILHFLILIHFPLAMFLCSLVTELGNALKEDPNVRKIPYSTYKPLEWIFTGLLSFFGDLILLTWAARAYVIFQDEHITDECQDWRIIHIAYDSVAAFTSLVTILWFTVFSFYTINRR
jgi:hypothetical protein